jgi:hypothetical protein
MTNKCRHFTGVQHKTCSAGLSYSVVADIEGLGKFGCWNRLPCTGGNNEALDCPSLDRYTDSEVKQQRAEADAKITLLMPLWGEVSSSPDRHGTFTCPICQQHGEWSKAYNGHSRGSCDTEGCLSWMQ